MKVFLKVPKNKTLYHVLREKGFIRSAYCGGRGICGKCKVKVNSEEVVSCLMWGPFEGEVEVEEETLIYNGTPLPSLPPSEESGIGVALDLGTTGIEAAAFDLKSGNFLKSLKILNFQTAYGADVVTRVEEALKGEYEKERKLLLDSVRTLLFHFNFEEIRKVVVVANTVIHHFFLGYPVDGFASYPFSPFKMEPLSLKGKQIGLEGFEEVEFIFPPVVGGFVGSDFLANVFILLKEEKNSFLVADLGTNAEIGLVVGEEFLATSVPAGPAFEGMGLFSGMRAVEGAISKLFFDGRELRFFTVGNGKPKGMCASAYFDLIYTLRNLGLIDKEGTFVSSPKVFKERFITVEEERAFLIYEDEETLIALTQGDIRKFLLAKGAIFGGIASLVERGGIPDRVFFSGDFGSHLNPLSVKGLKVIPQFLPSPQPVGNLALKGASLLLSEDIEQLGRFKEKFNLVELAADKTFEKNYLQGLEF